MIKKNSSQIIKKKKSHAFLIFLLICLITTLYLILRISYVLNFDDIKNNDLYGLIIKRIVNPMPFKITFNYYSLMVFMIWLLAYALVIKEKAKPHPDTEWMGKEHGSNRFYTKDEVEDFISKKTDPIISFNENDILSVKNYLNNN